MVDAATAPDEESLRTPGFRPGVAVVLADGCAWQLPKPMVRFVPDDAHESGFQVRLSLEGDDGAWTKALALIRAEVLAVAGGLGPKP
jgi:hypothetical protein